MKFEIDVEDVQRRREQLRVINKKLAENHLRPDLNKGFRNKLVDLFEHSALVVVHALEERLEIVQKELALLRHTRQRDLIHVERFQLQENLQELSQDELSKQIDSWVTLEDTVKGLIEDFSFGEEVRE